jgi:hypothetical protein
MVYRKKRYSRSLEEAEVRASGLTAIDPNMDFGDERSLSNLNSLCDQLRDKFTEYNTHLTQVDTLRTEIKDLEKVISQVSSKMLVAVAFKYGKDSTEYQMAGGVRSQDRIRRSRLARMNAADEPAADAG